MHRRSAAALAAAVLALPLVAADHTPIPPTGEASTSMTAIELEVTGLPGGIALPGVTVLDGSTRATTVGAPWAGSSVTGLRLGDAAFSTVATESDGTTSDDTSLLDVETTATGWVGSVNPLSASAGADVVGAWSLFDAANIDLGPHADLGDLATGLGLGVHGATAESRVDDRSASANQSLTSASFHLTLGGIVEALEELPLDTILALIDELGLELPVDPMVAIGAVQDATGAVAEAEDAVVAAGEAFGDDTTGPVAEYAEATGDLPTVSDLQDTYDALAALEATSPTLLTELLAIMALEEIDACLEADVSSETALASLLTADAEGVIAELLACVAAEMEPLVAPFLDDPADFDPARGFTQLESAIADLETTIAGLVDALEQALEDLADAVAALDAVLATGDLATVLDAVVDLLDDLVDTTLVEVSELSVSVEAVAAATVEESHATIGCTVAVTVLGTAVGPQSCDGTIAPVLGAADTLNASIGEVRTLLAELPLDAGVDLEQLTVDAFVDPTDASVCEGGDAYHRVCEVDGTVHAVAGIRLLDLAVPTMTIDPSLATGTVATALDDGLAAVGALTPHATVDETLGAVAALLGDAGLGGFDDGLSDGDTVVGTALGDAQVAAAAIADQLDASTIGDLAEPVDTPAVSLSVDPVSVASFTAGAPADEEPTDGGTDGDMPGDGSGGDGGDPVDGAPDPDDDPDDPSLPHTGGGLALAGLLSLLGAAALRRRL